MFWLLVSTLDLFATHLAFTSPWVKVTDDNGNNPRFWDLYYLEDKYLKDPTNAKSYSDHWATILSFVVISLFCAIVGWVAIAYTEFGSDTVKVMWKRVAMVMYWLQLVSVVIAGTLYEFTSDTVMVDGNDTVHLEYFAGAILIWISLVFPLVLAGYNTWSLMTGRD